MRRVAGAIILVLFVAGAGLAQSVDPYLVTPGKGIGPLTIGMTITDATKLLGTPQQATTKINSVVLPVPEGALVFVWPPTSSSTGVTGNVGFRVVTDHAGLIYEIQSPFDQRVHTADGLRIGSKQQDVTNALGAPDRQADAGTEQFLIYDRQGVVFLVETGQFRNRGLVNGIWVIAPK
jgi:hypothetical protein